MFIAASLSGASWWLGIVLGGAVSVVTMAAGQIFARRAEDRRTAREDVIASRELARRWDEQAHKAVLDFASAASQFQQVVSRAQARWEDGRNVDPTVLLPVQVQVEFSCPAALREKVEEYVSLAYEAHRALSFREIRNIHLAVTKLYSTRFEFMHLAREALGVGVQDLMT
jgi:hypothetical protein